MSHPFFDLPGAEAYSRSDFAEAAARWTETQRDEAKVLDQEGRMLFRALVNLADSLEAGRSGDLETASERIQSARLDLETLPSPLAGLNLDALRSSLERPITSLILDPPKLKAAPKVPPKLLLRFAGLIALAVAGVIALTSTPLGDLLDREQLIALLGELRNAWWTPLALVGLYVLTSPLGLPASPLMLAGGVVFGALSGGLYNVIGTFLGAAVSFGLGKLLGRDLVEQIGGKRLRRVEKIIARQGFWPLVGVRFLPIPFPIINYGAALAGVRPATFLITTALGLAPSVFIWTYLAASVYDVIVDGGEASLTAPILALAGVFLLSVLPPLLQGRRRAKRYRALLEQRRRRE